MGSSTTPAFPANGPGTKPEFDTHELLLLEAYCPPEVLEQHVEFVGKELEATSRVLNSELDVVWPIPEDSPLGQAISRESLLEWDYDLFKLRDLSDGHPLVYMAHGIIQLFNLHEKLNLDMKAVHRYLCALERMYNKCIYHNPMHAADVLHATTYFLYGKTADAFPDDEILVVILASCGHDVGHPGVNNNFMIKQNHFLASRYSNKSVLENHHAALALALAEHPGMDIFSFLSGDNKERRDTLSDMLRHLVLGTDMSEHMRMVARLEEMAASRPLDLTLRDERILTCQLLIHSADLSNPGKPWKTHIQWTHAIVAEFFSQGDMERARGVDISPMCDRCVNCGRSSQKMFFVNFCRPLFVLCAKVLPDTAVRCESLLEKLDANVARWTLLGF